MSRWPGWPNPTHEPLYLRFTREQVVTLHAAADEFRDLGDRELADALGIVLRTGGERVIPADLGRELYEAAGNLAFLELEGGEMARTYNEDVKRLQLALARYEREVGE